MLFLLLTLRYCCCFIFIYLKDISFQAIMVIFEEIVLYFIKNIALGLLAICLSIWGYWAGSCIACRFFYFLYFDSLALLMNYSLFFNDFQHNHSELAIADIGDLWWRHFHENRTDVVPVDHFQQQLDILIPSFSIKCITIT